MNGEDIIARLERLERNVFQTTTPEARGSQEDWSSIITTLDLARQRPTGWQSINGTIPTKFADYADPQVTSFQLGTGLLLPALNRVKSSVTLPAAPAIQDLSQLMLRTSKYEAFLLGSSEPDNAVPRTLTAPAQFISCNELSLVLPSEALAEILLSHFIENISWVYRIIHAQTMRTDMRNIYRAIRENSSIINPQKLSLMASALATAAHFWYRNKNIPLSAEEARLACSKWQKLAERAIEESKYDIKPSIEALQATMVMNQFLPGMANTRRFFLDTTLQTARMMGLHQLDSKRNCERRLQVNHDTVDLEIKRRVWWHIVYNDWMLSYMSGPQEGTYLCHPAQMNVLLPTNTDDTNVTSGGILSVSSLSEPTEVTYIICKYWFSIVIRSFTDVASAAGLEVDELEYDQVLMLDEQCNKCMKELPYFFQLDDASKAQSKHIESERPYIAWQRELLHFGIHTRLSRLHRPFMTRGYKDPKYAYSRLVCLRSSRIVIELEKAMRETGNGMHQQTTSRLWIVVHHVFMASVTLVMDYCINRDDPRAEERKKEIMECYAVLERSQEESSIARKGLQHLKKVMNEWRAENGSGDQTPSVVSVPHAQAYQVPAASEGRLENDLGGDGSMLGGMDVSPSMDFGNDLWLDSTAFEGNFDVGQWDSLLSVLDSQNGIYGMGL